MEIFKTLLDQVDDEICGAKEYAELALSLKDDSPQLSSMYNDLSKQECCLLYTSDAADEL